MDEPPSRVPTPSSSEDVMRQLTLVIAVVALGVVPAAAQSSRIYGAGVAGVHSGALSVGTVSTIGGLAGIRMTDAWSIEFEMDKGSAGSGDLVFEGLLSAQVSGPGQPTPEELAHNGIFGRSVWRHSSGRGYSARVVWKTRKPGRVNAAVFGGVSARHYDSRHAVTITSIGPGVTYPAGRTATTSSVTSRTRTAGGLIGGIMVPIRIASGVTVAPELRFITGLIGDDPYRTVHLGTRLMWGF
jgi:hypothetical protein